jgi:hypothetical protein
MGGVIGRRIGEGEIGEEGCELIWFIITKETFIFHSATCRCIVELREVENFPGFSPELGFFADFLYVSLREAAKLR